MKPFCFDKDEIARVYDNPVDNKWFQYLLNMLGPESSREVHHVLDVGCGPARSAHKEASR
jgi:ubiquinone/menaquinone biosynthesis C-methylase UbiE